MTSVHITTTDAKAKLISYIANIFGATVTEEAAPNQAFIDKIKKRQNDLANGRSKTFTVEEFDNL